LPVDIIVTVGTLAPLAADVGVNPQDCTGPLRPRWPAPLVEPGAVFAHLLALPALRHPSSHAFAECSVEAGDFARRRAIDRLIGPRLVYA
jgi:hypothetical protein